MGLEVAAKLRSRAMVAFPVMGDNKRLFAGVAFDSQAWIVSWLSSPQVSLPDGRSCPRQQMRHSEMLVFVAWVRPLPMWRFAVPLDQDAHTRELRTLGRTFDFSMFLP